MSPGHADSQTIKIVPKQELTTDQKCEKCGSPMVLRTTKRGDRAGEQFYGCSRYPKCRSIINIE